MNKSALKYKSYAFAFHFGDLSFEFNSSKVDSSVISNLK